MKRDIDAAIAPICSQAAVADIALRQIQEARGSIGQSLESIEFLYRFGNGPSSSHTLGPSCAALTAAADHPDAAGFHVDLYGSLAATGKGHKTDEAIAASLRGGHELPVTFGWHPDEVDPFHTNKLAITPLDAAGAAAGPADVVYSVGGGALVYARDMIDGRAPRCPELYPTTSLAGVLEWCAGEQAAVSDIPMTYEDRDRLLPHIREVWQRMKAAIERGIATGGELPGGLRLRRRAPALIRRGRRLGPEFARTPRLMAYAMAVAEENAAGGVVVTAPTCGACGVLPGVLYYLQKTQDFDDDDMERALLTAGVVGIVAKANASISGAEAGCQAEIGVAGAMAAAAAAELLGGSPAQVETAAQCALEHALGLTCDPVNGAVEVPCIERNGVFACKALAAAEYALCTDGRHCVSFDETLITMLLTGLAMHSDFKETSRGGLAVCWDLDERIQRNHEVERALKLLELADEKTKARLVMALKPTQCC